MTAITQHIPNFSHGISHQPDYLKRPGQVRDVVNALPDVTQGLLKRPGGRRVNTLHTTSGGKWFTIYRDDVEQYIVQYKDGLFKVWSLIDGLERPVTYTTTPDSSYKKPGVEDGTANAGLGHCNPAKLASTLNDYRAAMEVANDMRGRINVLQAQIDAVEAKQDPVYYDVKKTGNNFYRVNIGYIETKIGNNVLVSEKRPSPLPDGTKITKGKRRLHNVLVAWNDNPDYSAIRNVDIYDYAVTLPSSGTSLDKLKDRIKDLKHQLEPLAADEDAKRVLFEHEAVACGSLDSMTKAAKASAADVPDYLKDASPNDIQVCTVNDYTFIANRQRTVVMNNDVSRIRKNEGIVELKTIAPNTVYSFAVALAGDNSTTTKTTARKISIKPASWHDLDDNKAKYTNTKTFTINQGAGKDLVFKVETRGQIQPISLSNASKGYKSVYTTSVELISSGTGWVKGDKVTVVMSGKEYTVRVDGTNSFEVAASGGFGQASTGQTSATTDIKAVLEQMKTNFLSSPESQGKGFLIETIGNSLHITHPTRSFNITTHQAEQYMNGFTDSVNNIARLPIQCVDGYIVRVANSGEQDDDYYVEFKAKDGISGTGTWEETVKPGIEVTINPSSMPHQLKRLANGTFQFGPIDWEQRLVGDNKTNPVPSFVGNSINKIFFFRNRLGFLSEENVVLSKAGDYFNFFAKTALTVSPSDPVDISASSTFPAVLMDAVPYMQGVVLFSPTQQFLLTTDQDVFSPETAKLILTSTFRYSTEVSPFNMGTTIGFMNKAGRYTRFMEMVGISRDRPPELIEQSRIVPELLPSSINCVADSRENDLVMFGTNTTSTSPANTVYGYRYFNDGEKRIQSAWFKWVLAGKLEHHAVVSDSYYSVTLQQTLKGERLYLMRYDLVPGKKTAYIQDQDAIDYPVALDNYVIANVTDGQYYEHIKQTYFHMPFPHDPSLQLVAFDIGGDEHQGRMIYPRVEVDADGHWCVLDGDWSDSRIVIGYDFEMKVVLPHLYVAKDDAQANKVTADTRSSLVISRVKFDFGESGTFNTVIKRKGRPDYEQMWETRPSDHYKADSHSVAAERGLTIPIYDRNTNVFIELTSKHPTPATLFSMDWEGNYSPLFYRRV